MLLFIGLDNNPLVNNPNGHYAGHSHHIQNTEFRYILDIVHENFITYRNECYPFLQNIYCEWGMENF